MSFDAFEDLLGDDNFQPHEIFATGQKNDKGEVTITDEDLINGRVPKKTDTDTDDNDNPGGDDNKGKPNKVDLDLETDKLLDKALDSGKFGEESGAGADEDDDDDDDKKASAKNQQQQQSGGDDNNPLKIFYNMMVQEGLWEEDPNFDGSDEAFEEIKAKNLEKMREEDVNDYLSAAFEANPDGVKHGKALLSHLAKGGKIKDFVELHESSDITEADLDSDNADTAVSAAEQLTRTYLKLIGWDKEDIDTTIRTKKEKNTIVEYGKELLKPYQKKITEIETERAANADKEAKARRTNAIKYTTSVNDIVNTQEKVGFLEIPKTPKEKKALVAYMLTPVDGEDGQQRTQLAHDFNKLSKDPEFSIFLAQSLRTWTQKKPNAVKKSATSSTKDSVISLLGGKAAPKQSGKVNQPAQQASSRKADWDID